MGAPIKFKDEHCEIAQEILARGKSLAAVCAHFSIARSTLYEWRDTYPQFKDALDAGLQKAQAQWEEIGEDGIKGNYDKFAGSPWIFTMKNRFRADYADDKEDKDNSAASVLEKIIKGDIKVKND